ncbi:MAG: hypothetical protein OYH76_01200 [Defluviicoccus sp.]|nr:hypothetical protein [Defluviicoccus sp.]MDE0274480.1 hypothetical protein [Defluviicoccus sp.]
MPVPISFRQIVTLAGLLAIAPIPDAFAQRERTWPTPEISVIREFKRGGTVAYVMRGELGNTGFYLGMAFSCTTTGPRKAEVTVLFGGFPADRRPVQLAVRLPDGSGKAYGPVLRGGSESGFHSPLIRDPRSAEAFARAALTPDALISNGYRSFFNRASDARNRQVRDAFIACLRR